MCQSKTNLEGCCSNMLKSKQECTSNQRICGSSLSSCSNHQSFDDIHTTTNQHLQSILSKQLGPEYISTRPGAAGCKLSYIEGWRIIALANEIFGYDGWNSETKSIEVDFVDQTPDGRFNVGVSAIVRICLKNGNSHEDVGYGKLENSRSKADALDKCKKEAVTDALKRTMRTFGNVMGNCLYDKSYLNNIKTMQAQKEKFLPSKLYRPEHVTNRTSNTTECKPPENQPIAEVNIPQKAIPTASLAPCRPVPQISKLTNDLNQALKHESKDLLQFPKLTNVSNQALKNEPRNLALISKLKNDQNQVLKDDTKDLKPNKPVPLAPQRPKMKLPDKRKLVEEAEEEAEEEEAAEEEEEEEEDDEDKNEAEKLAPLPMTLSDNYFDLDEEDLAGLDLAESNEIFGVQPTQVADICSPDESGLITDTSLQVDGVNDDSMMKVTGLNNLNNSVSSKNSINNKILEKLNAQPHAEDNTTNYKSLIDPTNSSKFALKHIPNQFNKPTTFNNPNPKVIIQAGRLPTIKAAGVPLNPKSAKFNHQKFKNHSATSQDGLNTKVTVSAIRYPTLKANPTNNNNNNLIFHHQHHSNHTTNDRIIKKLRTG